MPQRIRHRVVFLAFLTSVLLYLDRFVLTYVERIIRLDLGLTEKQIGWGLSAFFWSYALAQVPSGLLTDRYGPRRMLTLYILLWSAATALMGWINGFAMLIAVRLAVGLAQAGAYPTCAAIVGRWVPLKTRGTASGLIAVGGRIGGGIAPLLTALLVVWFSADDSPKIRQSDLLNPLQVADQLAFANSHEELKGGTDNQARLSVLRRVTANFGAEQSVAVALMHGVCDKLAQEKSQADKKPLIDWQHRFGMSPINAIANPPAETHAAIDATAVLWWTALHKAADGPVLATPAEAANLPLETEAERTVLSSSPTDAELRRANRLILETVLPGCIRPFYSVGWRPVMWVYGAAGILVAALFWFVVRDWPNQHPRISETELAEIEAGRPPQSTTSPQTRPRLPLETMLTSRGLWLISGSQFFANIAWTFLVLQLPRYLQEAHHASFADRSLYASIPLWCGWGGMFLGGIATDRCVKRFGLRLGRVIPLVGSRILGTAAFLGLLLEPSLPIALALLSLVAVAADFASPATWAFNQDIGGRFIASTLGWGNMWGNIGSALSPLILAETLQRTGSWTAPFLLCATTFAIAGLCTLFLDPTQSIDLADEAT